MSATITVSTLGTELQDLLLADEIEPGSEPSYQLCKTIYSNHPLGAKMAKYPIKIALSQPRDITVPGAPDMAVTAFRNQWKKDGCNVTVMNAATLARVYGAAAIALVAAERTGVAVPLDKSIDPAKLPDLDIAFNVLDPLNTGGTLINTQNATTIRYQNPKEYTIEVGGNSIHPSRTLTVLNEEPIYLNYTSSAFGYVGRSVYQRALFPLKTFLQTCITDDLIVVKAGVLVAMIKQGGSIINNAMAAITTLKRNFVKEAKTSSVLSIGSDDRIESLNLQNLEGPFGMARTNALHNVASAADMPAILLNSETYASGFGEGTQDAKSVADYTESLRDWMQPIYDYLDPIVQRRAWSPAWYETMQAQNPDWQGISYDVAFYKFQNAFSAVWPSLLTEPESEKVKTDDVKLKALIAAYEVLAPGLDPENKARAVMWLQDNFNQNQRMFGTPLELDFDELRAYDPMATAGSGSDDDKEPSEPAPFSAQDSQFGPRPLRLAR